MKLLYYAKHLVLNLQPKWLYNRRYLLLERTFAQKSEYVTQRVDYYVKGVSRQAIDGEGTQIANYRRKGFTSYFFDLQEFLHYFPKSKRFKYYFGDETHKEKSLTLFKARPINRKDETSVLFKLDKRRHFKFVKDTLPFLDKQNKLVFRGAVTQVHREQFLEAHFNNPLVDAGQTNPEGSQRGWKKPFMSIKEQLGYKFILCLEGNDVASNLKWVMSSNSLVFCPKMKFETWFMEGSLVAGQHYVEIMDDYSDLDEKVEFYIQNTDEAQTIIQNAHDHVSAFLNSDLEDFICIKTLERYFELTGQV
ncbi:lipopolysaccharide A protein [Alginatibacterium sediminis]|uniref:Lipopolysaccharide A protein n=1 Tax=Alginatibacterium sediminis TaxID=2164068 RepID=A0A420EN67_9ALTE|nr:glycosyl transferase family 90 [Alginatibacterium sediminis]RKF22159.1 lipopolysaccharide A protein [Alginatibacterium sediminis]